MIKQTFINSKMDLQSDERLLSKGDYRKSYNIRASSSENSDSGAIENLLGNEKLTILNLGTNPITIGADRSIGLNRIYWLVKTDQAGYFVEHNITTGSTTIVLEDSREGSNNVLGLSEKFPVERIVIIEDFDNNRHLAIWTDGNKEVRCVNIERAKGYGANNFDEDTITLIKRPPFTKPSIRLENTNNNDENNISEKFLRFSYSYVYLDGERSPLSSFTNIAFNPSQFNYDFTTSSNESMVNIFNKVVLSLNTGSSLVTDVIVVFKESNSDVPYIVDTYNKEDLGWSDNEVVDVEFFNNKISKVLPQDELFRISDNIPKKAKTLERIDNRIMLSDYTENHNLIDSNNDKVSVSLSLNYTSTPIQNRIGTPSMKSLIDYELGIEYLDLKHRPTSVLTSPNNTTFISASDSDKSNKLQCLINNLAPSFAKAYRLFIKQSRYSYDSLVPVIFYNDEQFVWIKLENGEQDKIKEGDYLLVKSDTSGLLSSYVETRVIEIKQQDRNFLETDENISEIKQVPGLYYKIKPIGFQINEDDISVYEFNGRDDSSNAHDNAINDEVNVIEKAVYYGNGTLDDLSSSGNYTGNVDIRYIIEIQDNSGAADTFRWSDDDGLTYTENVAITGGVQSLNNGVEISFGSTTGHFLGETWIVSAKDRRSYGFGEDEGNFSYAVYPSLPSNGNINVDDVIQGGARIRIRYYEYNEGNQDIEKEFTSSTRYANLEEWWYGDNIADQFDYPIRTRVYFRRGVITQSSGYTRFYQDPTGDMCLIIKSIADQTGADGAVRTVSEISITQFDFYAIFETKVKDVNSDTFYEIGDTYSISPEGYHLGLNDGDFSQNASSNAVININTFNCFAWGNGFESYKIKDQFNGAAINIDTRPNTFIDDYRENYRKGGIVWGNRYEQTTNYNTINEFNASLTNFIDLDDANGACRYLFAKGKTLIAFQENRVTPLGYRKSFIYDQQGTATFTQSDEVLTIPESYAGEYGISNHPGSFAYFGNRVYFTDARRGSPMRLSTDGISEINILTKDFFKDLFTEYPNARYEAGYDPYFDEYLLSVIDEGVSCTIGFKESGYSTENKGWTSFYNFAPEKIIGINNRLYTIKEGQLWLHNSEIVPRNNFYGVQYNSKVTTVFNDDVLNDKIFKTLALSGNKPWSVKATTNLSESTIEEREFKLKESRYYAYLRQNENSEDLKGGAVQGIGNIQSHEGNVLTFNTVSEVLSIGNKVYQVVNGNKQLIGEVQSFTSTTITLVSLENTPVDGSFCFNLKNPRIEAGNMRGYYLEVELENEDTDFVELFAVESNMVSSDLHSN